jgi:hypothetical protein
VECGPERVVVLVDILDEDVVPAELHAMQSANYAVLV